MNQCIHIKKIDKERQRNLKDGRAITAFGESCSTKMYFNIILGASILFSPVLRKCNGDDFSKMHPNQIFKVSW